MNPTNGNLRRLKGGVYKPYPMPRKFVTLKWIKKGEKKSYRFYESYMDLFRNFGMIHDSACGEDKHGRLHVHFLYTPLKYFRFKDFIPPYLHINYVNERPQHVWYLHKHHRVPLDSLYPAMDEPPCYLNVYEQEQHDAIKYYSTHYAFTESDD